MKLADVVPWGRSFNEYREMFSLTANDLNKKILGCGDGPASFNAKLTATGGQVISADPIYAFSDAQIRARIDAVYPEIIAQVRNNSGDYIWNAIPDIDTLGRLRMAAMETFLTDFEDGKGSGRYIPAGLPTLPFGHQAFDLALCSHYLFLYSEQINETQHIASLKALCRVAKEVRIYPLLALDGTTSRHLEPVITALEKHGIRVSLEPVTYQFQKGATDMLVAKNRESHFQN